MPFHCTYKRLLFSLFAVSILAGALFFFSKLREIIIIPNVQETVIIPNIMDFSASGEDFPTQSLNAQSIHAPWKVIGERNGQPIIMVSDQAVRDGVALPPDTNVLLHTPDDLPPNTPFFIGFGGQQTHADVSLWGYAYDGEEAERLQKAKEEGGLNRENFQLVFAGDFMLSRHHRNAYGDSLGLHVDNHMFKPGTTYYIQLSKEMLFHPYDSDADYLSDAEETRLGLNPHNADTDGDVLPDGVDSTLEGFDPLDTDSNDNGIPDGQEYYDSLGEGYGPCKEDFDPFRSTEDVPLACRSIEMEGQSFGLF